MKYMGLDIGGANTDCVIIEFDNEYNVLSIDKDKYYLPFWSDHERLPECLLKLKGENDIDVICVSITAELADCYMTKKEGVLDITSKVMDTFTDEDVYFVTFDGLKEYDYVKDNPLCAAAANWVGTANVIKQIRPDCIFMDMGTTTTDIIPIKDGILASSGFSDTQRLGSGELVYTGLLRTNVATIVDSVVVNGVKTSVSSELFTTTADVNMVLGNITSNEYSTPTADGKDKTLYASKNRLSRLVCGDIDTVSDDDIVSIANEIYEKQVNQVAMALEKVIKRTDIGCVILSDIKGGSVCMDAAKCFDVEVINLKDYINGDIISIITAVGAISMYIEKYTSCDVNVLEKIYESFN